MQTPSDWTGIAADSKLNELLARYPTLGPILVQAGRGYVNRRGDLYAQYPDLSVAQYAELNGLEVGRLVRRLQAAAEAEDLARKITRASPAGDDDAPSLRRVPLTIGYTGSYDEREALGSGSIPVTVVQSERGPE
jgi:hypothetical protein